MYRLVSFESEINFFLQKRNYCKSGGLIFS